MNPTRPSGKHCGANLGGGRGLSARIEGVLAIVAPGQGAQTPGFLAPWLDLPGFRDRLQWLSAAANVDLVTHGTTSDEATRASGVARMYGV